MCISWTVKDRISCFMQEYQADRMILQEMYEHQYYRYVKLLLKETTDEFAGQNKRGKEAQQDVQEIRNRIRREVNGGSNRGVFKQKFSWSRSTQEKPLQISGKKVFYEVI